VYLKINGFAIHYDLLFHEICPYGGLIGLEELLIDVAE
jgi:hypothetical protein